MQARRQWSDFSAGGKKLSTQNPVPSENIFQSEGEIKSQTKKNWRNTLPEDLQEMLKEVLQAEVEWYLTETWGS